MNALVLGAGLSGEAAALLLLARGGRVTVVDKGADEKLAASLERVRQAGGHVLLGRDGLPAGAFDVCVASPAFERAHPWLTACRSRGIPLISELELGFGYWPGKVLAVTGSKGKSSVVKFCADTLERAGVSASPAGNYGIPLCRLALEKPGLAWAVTEVSSFQMEHTHTLKPAIAVLLNVQADHLDRHADSAEYKGLKLKLFANMDGDGLALLPDGFDEEGRVPNAVPVRRFGAGAGCAWAYVGHAVQGLRDGRPFHVRLAGSWFDNEVLGLSAAAAVAALARSGLSAQQIEHGFSAYEPLAHRVQGVGTSKRGVRFVDDSKATSLAATAAALRMVKKPVRLIAGGQLKENDLNFIKELLTQTTQKVYLIGDCSGQMCRAWASAVPCEECGTLEQAVDAAIREAQPGETVLLSPGTASFDQFNGYRERGERFTKRVRAVADL
jgi:UDP-N-acetylmuramoylalanine--D-glutamate ligase